MKRPYYDDQKGIDLALTSLAAFHAILDARIAAERTRDGKLQEFCVLGRWRLDCFGQIWTLHITEAMEAIVRSAKRVLTMEEFMRHLRARGYDGAICWNAGTWIPEAHLLCSECKRGWNLSNCHDAVMWSETKEIPLEECTGETLAAVRRSLAQKTDAIRRIFPERQLMIKNQRFIDMTLERPYPGSSPRPKNEDGWAGTEDGIDDTYVIQEGDAAFVHVWTYYHGQCNRTMLGRTEEDRFRAVLSEAGFTGFALTAIPNRYGPGEHSAPWFHVTLDDRQSLVIGWRKRVVNIDWSGTRFRGDATNGDNVTKGEANAHAWTREKQVEYLTALRQNLERINALA